MMDCLPIKEAELVRLQKGDVFVFKFEYGLNPEQVIRLRAMVEKELGRVGFDPDDIAIMAMEAGSSVSVIRRDKAEPE